jgi:hypothetical protein
MGTSSFLTGSGAPGTWTIQQDPWDLGNGRGGHEDGSDRGRGSIQSVYGSSGVGHARHGQAVTEWRGREQDTKYVQKVCNKTGRGDKHFQPSEPEATLLCDRKTWRWIREPMWISKSAENDSAKGSGRSTCAEECWRRGVHPESGETDAKVGVIASPVCASTLPIVYHASTLTIHR